MLLIPPNYGLYLRIYHPDIDPDEITSRLDIIPARFWMAGAQRNTPAGTLLEGVNRVTYWCHSFEITDEMGPNEFLGHVFQKLLPNIEFFEAIYNTGGRAEIYFTIRSCENAGETLKWAVLENLVKLKLDLSVELFP